MYEFVTEYWLAFIFGLAAAAITWIIKRYFTLRQTMEAEHREAFKQEIKESLKESFKETYDESLQPINERLEKIESKLVANTEGTLKLYKKDFYAECEELLRPEHKITVIEYDGCCKDHDVYNNMGGNDTGDSLFEKVNNKFKQSM